MAANKDLETVGHTFGSLTVLSIYPSAGARRSYLCACACGAQLVVQGTSLRTGNTKSCGCVGNKATALRSTRHGAAQRGETMPEYSAWCMTRQRCENPTQRDYARYGARGITVCARWQKFENFIADMGRRPVGYTLERLHNDRGYEPGNCVWATRKVQASNRSVTIRLTHEGQTKTIPEWAEVLDIKPSTLRARIGRLGYSTAAALSKPTHSGIRPC